MYCIGVQLKRRILLSEINTSMLFNVVITFLSWLNAPLTCINIFTINIYEGCSDKWMQLGHYLTLNKDFVVSSSLIPYIFTSVQYSFDNISIYTFYMCKIELNWLGKGLFSVNSVICQELLYSLYADKRSVKDDDLFNKTCRFCVFNELSSSSETRWCKKKIKSDVYLVKDAPWSRRPKAANSLKYLKNDLNTNVRFTTRYTTQSQSELLIRFWNVTFNWKG